MTVIAWDGKQLAADRRISFGNLSGGRVKIFRLLDHNLKHILVGACGSSSDSQDFLHWISAGQKIEDWPTHLKEKDNTFSAMVIDKDKQIYLYEASPHPTVIEQPFWAIGSGRDFAITAMHCGKSAYEAVEIAVIYDVYCGNGIDCLEFKS